MQTTKSHTHHLDPGDHRQCFWVTMTNRSCSGVRVPWQHGHVRFPQPDMRDQLAHLPPKCASVSLLSAAAGSLAIALAPWPALLLLGQRSSSFPEPGPTAGHPPRCLLIQSSSKVLSHRLGFVFSFGEMSQRDCEGHPWASKAVFCGSRHSRCLHPSKMTKAACSFLPEVSQDSLLNFI